MKIARIGVVKIIKPPNFIGAVIAAIPGSDAAVIGHDVETFAVMGSGCYRKDRLTGRIFAVLAWKRLRYGFGRFNIAQKIAVDAQPMHHANAYDLLFANHWHIIFALTSRNTS